MTPILQNECGIKTKRELIRLVKAICENVSTN